ncbi:histidine kinase [Clostridium acetobutylicum]|nr:histidine kinase [Clostridium acetobutylicum]
MLKIKSRIALLYSLLTIFFIIAFVISFCAVLKIYMNREHVSEYLTQNIKNEEKSISGKKHIKIEKSKQIRETENYIYENSDNGDIEKYNIQVEYNKNMEVGFVQDKDVGYIDVYKNKIGDTHQKKYTQNYLENVFDEHNHVIMSNILPDDYSDKDLNNYYGTKNLKIYSKNKISLAELLNKHTSGKLLVITDKNDNVIRMQSLSESTYDTLYGKTSDMNFLKITPKQFENVMSLLYEKFIYIVAVMIFIVILINCILSRIYVRFALRPLIEFTYKVRKQSNFEEIELIEMPKVKDEIYDLTVAYNSAIEKIKKSYDNVRRLNSYSSHELRNSLSVLKAKLELGEDVKKVEGYIDKLTNTTNNILAMSTSKLYITEDVDIALICAKVVDDYTKIFKSIELKLPYDGVSLVKGKELWIERCIANLIDNSIKFVDKNKLNNIIEVEVLEDARNIIVKVYDNGKGIDNQKIEEIFEPYYGTNRRVSTGIGLAYVKHIMDLHKGRVFVQSKEGEYFEIVLLFPKA